MADPLCNAGNGLLFLVSCYGSLNIFQYTNMENLSNNQELL